METARAFLNKWTRRLAGCGIDAPRLSAEVLLAEAHDIERGDLHKELILRPRLALAPAVEKAAESMLLRRLAGEPVAYILGRREFYGRDFLVTPATLIPRPETELLVEEALRYASSYAGARQLMFADLGSGSGCIAVTFALEYPACRGIAVDISFDALAVSRRNAQRYGAGNLEFLQGDFTRPLFQNAVFDLILSNPPYIGEEEYASLPPQVRAHEPKSALVPGPQGLEHARALAEKAGRALRGGGLFLLEIGWQQAESVQRMFMSRGTIWRDTRVLRDLSGNNRILYARRA